MSFKSVGINKYVLKFILSLTKFKLNFSIVTKITYSGSLHFIENMTLTQRLKLISILTASQLTLRIKFQFYTNLAYMKCAAPLIKLFLFSRVDVELETFYKNTSKSLISTKIYTLITRLSYLLITFCLRNTLNLSQILNYFTTAINVFELIPLSFLKLIMPSMMQVKFLLMNNEACSKILNFFLG